MLTDTTLHFMLLSGNYHSKENVGNQIFKPMQTSDNNEDVVDFVGDGNIFDSLDNIELFFQNIDFENDRDISTVLIEKLKSNWDDKNGLMLFNKETA